VKALSVLACFRSGLERSESATTVPVATAAVKEAPKA